MLFIKVKSQFEWFHKYKNAPKEVEFLRNLHRHNFGIIVKIEVNDLDRELEYFLVKREIDKIIQKFKKDSKQEESCETMAEYILDFLELKYKNRPIEVEVNEDGDCGSIINNF